jgi:hypothetical protein
MSAWWQEGYPGGPMVAVRGFPRPLYPPDAKPDYLPSIDGPDVEAYKRTVSRAGRWQWQKFDQAFSNAFAHGKTGGNVGESGIAGVQRQGHISPDTGFVGKQTFNLLRSIRVPAGLPHAGEPAMDATAVDLVNAAWERFGGHAAPPDAGGSSGSARLAKAQSQIGVTESPANSNQCKYTDWYGMLGPWCAMFCTWCDQLGGAPTLAFVRGSRYAYVPYIVQDARYGKYGLSITSAPKPGDLVCYDWSWDGEYDHVGIFESGNASDWTAIEGNTSPSNNSNGGEVMRRSRSQYDADVVFVRVTG